MPYLELAPNQKVMIVPHCEKCGARTIPVDSIQIKKHRECWNAYHNDGCSGTDKFKQSPYEGITFPLIFPIPFDPVRNC